MHVLTKIFIVLVSLLAVFLVPLVVVYAHNEDSYKSRWQAATIQAKTESELLAREKAMSGRREAELENQLNSVNDELARARMERDQALVEVRQLESRLVASQAMQAEIQGELRKLSEGVVAAGNINQSQLDELRVLRRDLTDSERKMVELDEAYRDVHSQLEVANAARRDLQEQLQRVNERQVQTSARLSEYAARFGALSDERDAAREGIIPDRDLTTEVTAVRRSGGKAYVEIAAGSRDGVREGWTMTIGRGSNFLAKVRIISVDISRSTGELMLEDRKRGLVQAGDVAQAWAGVD